MSDGGDIVPSLCICVLHCVSEAIILTGTVPPLPSSELTTPPNLVSPLTTVPVLSLVVALNVDVPSESDREVSDSSLSRNCWSCSPVRIDVKGKKEAYFCAQCG